MALAHLAVDLADDGEEDRNLVVDDRVRPELLLDRGLGLVDGQATVKAAGGLDIKI